MTLLCIHHAQVQLCVNTTIKFVTHVRLIHVFVLLDPAKPQPETFTVGEASESHTERLGNTHLWRADS